MAKVIFTKEELKAIANQLRGSLQAFRLKLMAIGSTNKRLIDALDGRVETLEEQAVDILGKLDSKTANARLNAKALRDLTGELETLNGKVDSLWTDLDKEVRQLRTDVDENTRIQGLHDQAIKGQDVRLQDVEAGVSGLYRYVGQLDGSDMIVEEKTPWLIWVVALLAGIVAGWFWYNIDFTQVMDQQLFTYEFAESPLGTLIAGLAVFALIAGVLGMLVSKTIIRTIRQRETSVPVPIPQPPHPAEAGKPTQAAGTRAGSSN